MSKEKVIIWGGRARSKQIYNKIKDNKEVLFFIDINLNKLNSQFEYIYIYPPNKLLEFTDYDKIIVDSSLGLNEIFSIVKEIKIPQDKIDTSYIDLNITNEINNCYLCNSSELFKRPGHTRDNKNIYPLECKNCQFVQLSSISHINNDFYEKSHMHDNIPINVKLLEERNYEDTQRRYNQLKHIIYNKDILDFGCGTGDFLLACKDIVKSVCGVEPEKKLYSHFKKNNLEVYPSIDNLPKEKQFDVVTLFHVLEHIQDPIEILKQIKQLKKNNSPSICIIEVPSSEDALLTLYNNKEFSTFTYWSCHLYLFNENTLKICAEKAGLKTIEINQFQRYPLTNHLYWLSHGKPGGQNVYKEDLELNRLYSDWLAKQKKCDTIIGKFYL